MLYFIKKDVRSCLEAEAEELQRCLDPLIVFFLKILSVQGVFEVEEEEVVAGIESVSDEIEEGRLACPSHAGEDDRLRGFKMPFYIIEYRSRVYHIVSLQ